VAQEYKKNLEIYRTVLSQAWEDGIVTRDEFAIMEQVREGLGITFEDHLLIEEEVYLQLARKAFKREDPTDSLDLIDIVLDDNPKNELAWLDRGFYLYGRGDMEEAVKCFDRVLELNGDNNDAKVLKGVLLDNLGDPKEALQWFRKALTDHPLEGKEKVYKRVLTQAWADGVVTKDEGALIEKVRKGLKIPMKRHMEIEIDVYMSLARDAFQHEDHDEAISFYDRVLDREPGNVDAMLNKGFHLRGLGDYTQAIDCFENVIRHYPYHRDARVLRALTLDLMERTDDAMREFKRLLEVFPDDEWILMSLAEVYTARGQKDKALECHEMILKSNPDHPVATRMVAELS